MVLFKDKLITQNNAFTYIGEFYEPLDESDYYYDDDDYEVLTSYNEYQKYFDLNELPSIDFTTNNYVVIPIRYDSCSESEITPTDYEIIGNHLNITVKYKGSCGLCAQTFLYYLLKVDKNITYVNVNMNYIMTII